MRTQDLSRMGKEAVIGVWLEGRPLLGRAGPSEPFGRAVGIACHLPTPLKKVD